MALLISAPASRYWGYFTAPGQEHPVYDPGPDAPCPICDTVLADQDVRTISVMYVERRAGREMSCFYRTHKACHEALTDAERDALEGNLMDLLPTEGG